MISANKVALPLPTVISVVLSLGTGAAAYYRSMNDTEQKLLEMKQQFMGLRLEQEQQFVRKTDLKELQLKLDSMKESLDEIKGYLRGAPSRR